MRPQAEGQLRRSGVLHRDRSGEAALAQRLPHPQAEGVGIGRPGLGAVPQLQLRPVFPVPGHRKLLPPGKPMALHTVCPAREADRCVRQSAHDREQQRVTARPDGGVPLPDVFQSLSVPAGYELSSHRIHLGAICAVLQREMHRLSSFRSYLDDSTPHKSAQPV